MRILAPRRMYAPDGSADLAERIPGPARALWWLAGHIVAPVAIVAAVLAWRWLTGAPLRPGYRGRRYVTRPVRAAGQTLVTVLAVCLAVWPVATASALGTLGLVLVAVASHTRRRARTAQTIRVRVTVRRPAGHLTDGRPC